MNITQKGAAQATTMTRKPKPLHSAQIEGLSHEGRGTTRIDGKVAFIFGALPGETVDFHTTRRRGSFNEGEAVNVRNPSPDRVTPECPHFAMCGGCSLQHLEHSKQVLLKQNTVKELLEKQNQVIPDEWLPPLTDAAWRYRRKARLSVRFVPGKDKVLVGFRERRSHFVTNITECRILDPKVGTKIEALSQLLYSLEAREAIPQLEVAISDEKTTIILRHTQGLNPDDLKKLLDFGRQHDYQWYLQSKGPDSIIPLVADHESAPPLLSYSLEQHQLRLEYHPTQFTQINEPMNRKMIDQALTWLDLKKDENVLDLFCGIGNFSLPIARQAKQVVGVEGAASAVGQAKANAALNQISNAHFYVADLNMPLEKAPFYDTHYDAIILDPPRCGAEAILPSFTHWKPSRILYISCGPSTFARDAAILEKLGYTLKKMGVMDLFPHTQHIECMGLFEWRQKKTRA